MVTSLNYCSFKELQVIDFLCSNISTTSYVYDDKDKRLNLKTFKAILKAIHLICMLVQNYEYNAEQFENTELLSV